MSGLPPPRGEISELVEAVLARPPHRFSAPERIEVPEPLEDGDLHLALYLLYELHYRGLPGVDDAWEWEPSLLALRAALERPFESALRDTVPRAPGEMGPDEIDVALREIAELPGPPLSTYVRGQATLGQVREFLIHRSAYQLKEADPHSWALPRLYGPVKAALVEIQTDEYGRGRTEWMHAELFARAMAAAGLDANYNAYLDLIPGITLATVNLMSLFGLHRRLLGAIVGHLAVFELTSSIPNRRYGDGLRRLGLTGDATLFFDEHVEADAVHENIAATDLAGGLVRQQPALSPAVLWGARALHELDSRWADYVLGQWRQGRTSLRRELNAGPRRAEPHQLVGAVAEGLDP